MQKEPEDMIMTDLIKIPCNKNSQQCVRNVMSFLADISGDKIVTGQHTQTMEMEDCTISAG